MIFIYESLQVTSCINLLAECRFSIAIYDCDQPVKLQQKVVSTADEKYRFIFAVSGLPTFYHGLLQTENRYHMSNTSTFV